MTQDTASSREDARALQLRLYREIGISAVAAALRFTAQPDPAPRAASALDGAPGKPQVPRTRAA